MPEIRFLSVGRRRLAYELRGDGPPLVAPAWWVSHLELDWESERYRRFWEGLADGYMLIRYDRLGVGVSDRTVRAADLTLEREVETLRALLDELGLERVSLVGGALRARATGRRGDSGCDVRAAAGKRALPLARRRGVGRPRVPRSAGAGTAGPPPGRTRAGAPVAARARDPRLRRPRAHRPRDRRAARPELAHTVHRHVANIRRKLGRGSRTAAVAEAARLGLL